MENHEFATEGGEMKITREMLAEMRELAVEADRITDVVRLEADEFLALLDERKALRAALDQACGEITNWRHKEAVAALRLGEDEG